MEPAPRYRLGSVVLEKCAPVGRLQEKNHTAGGMIGDYQTGAKPHMWNGITSQFHTLNNNEEIMTINLLGLTITIKRTGTTTAILPPVVTIDEHKRARDLAAITESPSFVDLLEKVNQIRAQPYSTN